MDRVLMTLAPEFWQAFTHYAVEAGNARVLFRQLDKDGFVICVRGWGAIPALSYKANVRRSRGAVAWPESKLRGTKKGK
jgi:hypothetical protein